MPQAVPPAAALPYALVCSSGGRLLSPCINQQYLQVQRKLHTGHRKSVQGAMSCPKLSPLSVQKKTQSTGHVNDGFSLEVSKGGAGGRGEHMNVGADKSKH